MNLHADSTNIDSLLKEYTYIVPDYQRVYSWNKLQVDELLEDIDMGIGNGSDHFFGAMMLNVGRKKKEGKIEIIDGQQRFTTVIMLLYAILEMYNLPRFSHMENIGGRMHTLSGKLAEKNDDGQIIAKKLTLGDGNKQFFESYIIDSLNNNIEKEKIIFEYKKQNKYNINKKIIESYEVIKDYFIGAINSRTNEGAYELLKNYQSYILKSLEIVRIEVEEDADAFLIFETLNDRGLALSSVDLIKNTLFKNCANSSEFESIKEKWTSMISNLDDINEVKKYIRHYWISKQKYVSTQNLFKEYRGYVNSDFDKSKEIINELHKYSKFYYALSNPRSGYFSDEKLISTLECMNKFKFDLTHPILISTYIKYQNEIILYKTTKLCLNFLIRYISISKGKPTAIEKKIGEIAVNSNQKEISDLFIENSDNNELKDTLRSMNLNYKSYLAYYCLVEYEKILHKNEPWRSTGRTDITVEHILPQTIKSEDEHGEYWISSFKGEENCKLYQNRLGNLTLLGKVPQNKGKNYNFNIKKDVYKKFTDMFSTKELIEYTVWNRESIENRQNKMAETLCSVLTLDISNIK